MNRKSMICVLFVFLVIVLLVPIAYGQSCERGYPHVPKKDGTYDPRENDLWELAQDWVFFRSEALKCQRKGDVKGAKKASRYFQETNLCLEEYSDNHVYEAVKLAEECMLKKDREGKYRIIIE